MKASQFLKFNLILLGFALVSSAPSNHFGLGTKSTYHGILGTFDVFPVDSAPIYSSFIPQTFGYTINPGYNQYYQYLAAADPALNYYNPAFVGSNVVPFLESQFPAQVQGIPIPSVPSVPNPVEENNPEQIVSGAVVNDDSVSVTVPDSVANDYQSQAIETMKTNEAVSDEVSEPDEPSVEAQNDSVNFDDDNDSVTIESN